MTTARQHDGMPDIHHVEAYLRQLTLAGYRHTTIKTYRGVLLRAVHQLPRGLCAYPDELAEWIARGDSRNTRATSAAALRGFYRWCQHTGRLTYNPMDDVATVGHKRGYPRPVTHDELARLLTGAREPYRLWCLLAAYAGARCIEISRLHRDDITQETVYLAGKGDRDRAVPTHPAIWAAIADLPPGPVAACNAARVSAQVSRECHRLGLTGVTAHRLRHWAGTWWQAATGDVRVTQELLGHASPATTAVYTAVSDQARRAAVLGLPVIAATGAAGAPTAAGAHRQAPPAAALPPVVDAPTRG